MNFKLHQLALFLCNVEMNGYLEKNIIIPISLPKLEIIVKRLNYFKIDYYPIACNIGIIDQNHLDLCKEKTGNLTKLHRYTELVYILKNIEFEGHSISDQFLEAVFNSLESSI